MGKAFRGPNRPWLAAVNKRSRKRPLPTLTSYSSGRTPTLTHSSCQTCLPETLMRCIPWRIGGSVAARPTRLDSRRAHCRSRAATERQGPATRPGCRAARCPSRPTVLPHRVRVHRGQVAAAARPTRPGGRTARCPSHSTMERQGRRNSAEPRLIRVQCGQVATVARATRPDGRKARSARRSTIIMDRQGLRSSGAPRLRWRPPSRAQKVDGGAGAPVPPLPRLAQQR